MEAAVRRDILRDGVDAVLPQPEVTIFEYDGAVRPKSHFPKYMTTLLAAELVMSISSSPIPYMSIVIL